MKKAHEFLRTRRSVRRFRKEAIPEEVLERVLMSALWAPSAHNRQPWRFVVVQSAEKKERLAMGMAEIFKRDLVGDGYPEDEAERKAQRSIDRIREAPAAILLCMDASDLDIYPDKKRQQLEHLMGVQSVSLAGGTLLLAAHAEGLGAVWICSPMFAPKAVRTALELPETWDPQGLILIGYPYKTPEGKQRRALSEVVRYS